MKKEDKNALIESIQGLLSQYPHVYLTDIEGMNAAQTSDLRRKCFEKGIKLVVVKNKLLHQAMEKQEADYSGLYDALKGSTALMFCETANVPAKLIKALKEKKAEKPVLKAAYAEETVFFGADQLDVLAALKSKNELIGEIITLLQSPAKNVVSALQSGGSTIHGVLKTLGERPE